MNSSDTPLFDPSLDNLFADTSPAVAAVEHERVERHLNSTGGSGTICLRYKTTNARTGLFIIGALVPIWGLWIPYALFCFARSVCMGTTNWQLVEVTGVAVAFVLSVGFGIWACVDGKVEIDADGIKLPIGFLAAASGKRKLLWSQLKSVVYRSEEEEFRSTLSLKFDRATIKLKIAGFSKDDLRKLILAAQTHCTKIARQEEILKQAPSFTTIWEEELNSRFAPTVFVPLQPGAKLQDGRIEILGQTACGGLSSVYLGRMQDGRRVIVKEAVAPSRANNEVRSKALEMFDREAHLLQSLKHRRISSVLDHFQQEGRHYLVMDHIPGIDLRRFIKDNGNQHEEIVLRWATEIADVLCYLHSRVPPILHRDLTPDNLIFTAEGGIAVIDFGAANAFLAEATGTLVGKQSYIAPEQFRGHATPQSDIYSLGCTMHFLLTSQDPEPLSESHPATINNQVSEITDKLVARCTALDLDERIENADMLLTQLHSSVINVRRSFTKAGI
ncbi:MAG TPA: serine/threonine-protein kinase [Trichormus sp.]|jgi:tRNA A-37 threonylcarbamoyl transferase component Bud32